MSVTLDKTVLLWAAVAVLACTFVSPAYAETQISFYLGHQSAPPSQVSTSGDRVIPNLTFTQRWTGRSFEMPIYAGARITRWRSDTFGWGLDFAHNKVKPPAGAMPPGFNRLEFTDGLNTWTVNAYYRWPGAAGKMTPYVGAGVGVAAPGVEVRYGGSDTFEYQVTGPAATWLAGVSVPLSDQWSLFGEYKGTFTSNTVSLVGGGDLKSDVTTHAANFGISFQF